MPINRSRRRLCCSGSTVAGVERAVAGGQGTSTAPVPTFTQERRATLAVEEREDHPAEETRQG